MSNSYFYDVGYASLYNYKDKIKNVNNLIRYMLARTQTMFEYNGLPETIPQRMLEIYLQSNGFACISKVDGNLYAFYGGLGGPPDAYYMPTICSVANPALKFSKNLIIDKECIIIPSDSMFIGLIPMFSKYANLINENDITMRIADINTRMIQKIVANGDRTKASAEIYIKKISDGEIGVIASDEMFGNLVETGASTTSTHLTELTEYQQYLKSAWFMDIGLNSNYNMKREAINTAEASLNDSILIPLIDDMLTCRQNGLDKVNKMYGTQIKVSLSGAWREVQQEQTGEEVIENDKTDNKTDDSSRDDEADSE